MDSQQKFSQEYQDAMFALITKIAQTDFGMDESDDNWLTNDEVANIAVDWSNEAARLYRLAAATPQAEATPSGARYVVESWLSADFDSDNPFVYNIRDKQDGIVLRESYATEADAQAAANALNAGSQEAGA